MLPYKPHAKAGKDRKPAKANKPKTENPFYLYATGLSLAVQVKVKGRVLVLYLEDSDSYKISVTNGNDVFEREYKNATSHVLMGTPHTEIAHAFLKSYEREIIKKYFS